jgi:gamma-glutamyltranspeptidase/glutathione hydrolase
MSRSVAVADDPVASEAAEDVLLTGGSALGAVVAGFLAAVGAHSGVLLSPVTVLAAGGGLGARAFDGRCRQPGLGTKRPRGFKDGEEIPDAARIAVPASLTAALVALAYDEQAKVSRIVKSAIKRARDSGAEARAELLERVRAVGAGAVSESVFVRPLMHAGGEASGGLITSTDLRSITDVDRAATHLDHGGSRYVIAPWAEEGEASIVASDDWGTGHAICAIDVRGLFAALSYRRVMNGVSVEDLEVEAPPIAVPVLRGVTRVSPGSPIAAPAPIAIRLDDAGTPIEILAAPGAKGIRDMLAAPKLRVRWDPVRLRTEVIR